MTGLSAFLMRLRGFDLSTDVSPGDLLKLGAFTAILFRTLCGSLLFPSGGGS
jgi:hypothetical protein